MAKSIKVKVSLPVTVEAKYLIAGSQVHVLEAYVLGGPSQVILLSRFDENSVAAVYNQIVAEALEKDREEADNDIPS